LDSISISSAYNPGFVAGLWADIGYAGVQTAPYVLPAITVGATGSLAVKLYCQAYAKKTDIAFIDRVQKELGMSDDQRELLHEEITGQNYTEGQIWEIAEEIMELYPNK